MLKEVLLLGVFLLFMKPLLGPLAYGAVLAVALYPIYKIKKSKWFAFILIFISVSILFYMFYLMSITVFDQIETISQLYYELAPETQVRLVKIGSDFKVVDFVLDIVKLLPRVGINFLFFIIFSFCFLVDGHKIKGFLEKIMKKDKAKILVNEGLVNLNAVVKGVFMNNFLYIFLSTGVLYFTKCPSPLIYSIVAGLFGLLPVLGAPMIYAYLIYLKLIEGSYISAIILVSFQFLWWIVIDYVIKAKYHGTLHPVVLLGSMMAGIYHFGFSGVIIGPLIATFFITMSSVYKKE